MNSYIGPLVLLVVACLIGGPVLALIALARIGRLTRSRDPIAAPGERLDAIDARLAALSRRVAALERPTAPAAAVERPAPAPEGPAPPIVRRPEPAIAPGERPSMLPPIAARPEGRPPRPPVPPASAPARAETRTPLPDFTAGGASSRTGPPPSAPIDWERWIGIRGAAVVGAVALGLAGLLFFKYSIEQGLVTPTMRVVFGTLTGLGCLVGAEWLRSRGYRQTSEGISGAGVVILYSAFWAAHVLYHLVGMPIVFGLMVLVTAACCLLAVRHASLLVAVLGLVGGFATPLLLSSGADRPIGLFGYVLLLDLGLLLVGRRRSWPSLGVLSLLGTVLLQALWIVARMGPERLFLGLVILAVFAVLFVVARRLAGGGEPRGAWLWSQVGAILFPFAFALYFAARVGLGPHLYPIAILLALLSAGAGWVSREQNVASLGLGAAIAGVVVTGVWLLQHPLTLALAWETVAVAVGLPVIFHLFVELDPEQHDADGPAPAALVAAGGYFVLLVFAAASAEVPIVPWLAGWSVIAGLLYRHAALPNRGVLQVGAAAGLAMGLSVLHFAHQGDPAFPPGGMFLAMMVGFCVVLH